MAAILNPWFRFAGQLRIYCVKFLCFVNQFNLLLLWAELFLFHKVVFGNCSSLLLRVKDRGSCIFKPYKTNCKLWIWVLQITFLDYKYFFHTRIAPKFLWLYHDFIYCVHSEIKGCPNDVTIFNKLSRKGRWWPIHTITLGTFNCLKNSKGV